jgi:hypothetical protein
MRRHLLVPLTVVALAVATSGTAFAFPSDDQPGALVASPLSGLIGDDDVFSTTDLTVLLAAPVAPMAGTTNGTQHYGPYTTPDSDSGCGFEPWNSEVFDRHFTVKSNHDGTYTVVEQFKNGSFTTIEGMSPGELCPEKNEPASVAFVDGGVMGSMHGYFIISNVGMQTSTSPSCDANTPSNPVCNTTIFINSHFAGACYPATCQAGTFFFHYAAGDQGLVEHEWKNASPDRGGNNGDISSDDPD